MSLCGLRLCSSGKNVYFCTFIVQKDDKIDSLMLKLFTGTIYDLRSWRLELICLLESSSLLRLKRGVAGLLRIMTFTWKHQVLIRNDPVLLIISTCSSIWSRFCLEFLRFSLEAAVDILNCLRASSSWDMGRVWDVVAELGSLRPTETS